MKKTEQQKRAIWECDQIVEHIEHLKERLKNAPFELSETEMQIRKQEINRYAIQLFDFALILDDVALITIEERNHYWTISTLNRKDI